MRRSISPASVDRSLLPEIIRLAAQREHSAGVHPRAAAADGGRAAAAIRGAEEIRRRAARPISIAHGAYYHDDWGDPDEPLSLYADGDHLTADGRVRYTSASREARPLLSVIFHSLDFIAFFLVTLAAYWALPLRAQNVLLLVASYVFYGWVHPWWPVLLFATTFVDYWSARRMTERPAAQRKAWLWLSIVSNLGLLGFYKYFGFFADNVAAAGAALGWQVPDVTLRRAAAGRHLVLHLPVDELHDRRVSRPRAGADAVHRHRGIRVVLPAPGGRADHARDESAAAIRAAASVFGRRRRATPRC